MRTYNLSSSNEIVDISPQKRRPWYLVGIVIAMSFAFGALPIIYGFTQNSMSNQSSTIPGETTLWSTAID